MRRVMGCYLAAIVFVISPRAEPQWLNYPAPGIPRLADGKPNLAGPVPKAPDGKPDLSGIWTISLVPYIMNVANDLKPGDVLPWAEALTKQRQENLGSDDPSTVHCLPRGPRLGFLPGNNFKIVQTSTLILFFTEDLTYRQIFLDGRGLPGNPNPDFMGYSVGRWEGDALVVTTSGYNDRTWLDGGGHPHTESLRTTERFHRADFGHLEITETFEDPNAYARPWTVTVSGELTADSDLLEYVCEENNKDIAHLVGKASDAKGVAGFEVPLEVLARYVGAYAGTLGGRPIRVETFLSGRELLVSRAGGAKEPLKPVSNTKFLVPNGAQVEFLEENGEIVLVVYAVGAGARLPQVREGR